MNRNYQKELEKIIEKNKAENKVPSLFLHSCCAPCSSYVLEYLSQYFEITDFSIIEYFSKGGIRKKNRRNEASH